MKRPENIQTENSLNDDKLKKYSLLAGAFITLTPLSEAQIIYTDVDPDVTVDAIHNDGPASYNLDLNNDGIIDFKLAAMDMQTSGWGSHTLSVAIEPQGSNQVIAENVSFYSMGGNSTYYTSIAAPLLYNELIAVSNGNWSSGNLLLCKHVCDETSCYRINDSIPASNIYLGLAFPISGQAHFGWARLDVLGYDKFKIKDYAYNAIPNVPVKAGSVNLPEPRGLSTNRIGSDSMLVTWDEIPGARKYIVYYKPKGSVPPIAKVKPTDNSVILTGLLPDTDYKLRIKAKYPGGLRSGFSDEHTFSTATFRVAGGAGIDESQIYSFGKSLYINTSINPIEGIVTIFNVSGNRVAEETWETGTQNINLESQPVGIYIVRLQSVSAMLTKKIFISN
jgi:hypothetical protein